jgi:hypothetical protein
MHGMKYNMRGDMRSLNVSLTSLLKEDYFSYSSGLRTDYSNDWLRFNELLLVILISANVLFGLRSSRKIVDPEKAVIVMMI